MENKFELTSGAGKEDLHADCNEGNNEFCDVVFRARSVVYAVLLTLILFLAIVVRYQIKLDTQIITQQKKIYHRRKRKSLFRMNWFNNIWMDIAILAALALSVPTIYIPWINNVIFLQTTLSWEWCIVAICWVVFFGLAEGWKLLKRRLLFRTARENMRRERNDPHHMGSHQQELVYCAQATSYFPYISSMMPLASLPPMLGHAAGEQSRNI